MWSKFLNGWVLECGDNSLSNSTQLAKTTKDGEQNKLLSTFLRNQADILTKHFLAHTSVDQVSFG